MPFSFSTALSGLRASADSIGVTGNNIANANTTAFKDGTISFADVFTDSLGVRLNGGGTAMQIGSGVTTAAIATDFTQGDLSASTSPTAAAIQGTGFFVVNSPSGAQEYTRAGDFSIDTNGYLVTPNGSRVQGYAAVGTTIPPGSALSSIEIPIGETTPPIATANLTMRMNLNSADAAGTVFHAPSQVYDSKGVSHSLDLTFTKQADGSYVVAGAMDGNAVTINSTPAGGVLTFDSNGNLTNPTSLSVVPDQTKLNGATLPSINVNLYQTNPDGSQGQGNITNYSSASAVAAVQQDGFAAGNLTGLSMSPNQDGIVSAVFSNGQVRPIAQIAVASFNAQEGLSHLGGNNYGQTPASGQPSIGAPGSGGRGVVVGNALEQSNVDLATEFTNLIVAQRSFQANSRVISTISDTLQNLIQNT